MDTKSYDPDKWMTIAQCLSISGYGNSHFRMHLLKEGKIVSKKEMIPHTNIIRTLVDKQSFESYLKSHEGTRVVMTDEERNAVKKLLAEMRKAQ